MPEPPEGEAELRDLAYQFAYAEGSVATLLGEAVLDRTRSTKLALEKLAALRLLDFKTPLVAAYLAEHPQGKPGAVRDLGGALAKRLDSAAKTAADGVRSSFARVTKDNFEELLEHPTTAAIDRSGNHWSLGHWAEVHCSTYGRHATSRGLADRVGHGGRVVVHVGQCSWCQSHSGEGLVGEIALPPYHPNCHCTASAA
jgi:hypothetical protein